MRFSFVWVCVFWSDMAGCATVASFLTSRRIVWRSGTSCLLVYSFGFLFSHPIARPCATVLGPSANCIVIVNEVVVTHFFVGVSARRSPVPGSAAPAGASIGVGAVAATVGAPPWPRTHRSSFYRRVPLRRFWLEPARRDGRVRAVATTVGRPRRLWL